MARWVDWALGEVGQSEVTGAASNPRIIQYRKISGTEIGGDDGAVPWCAIFVNAALRSAGVKGSGSAMARSFEHSKDFIRIPRPIYGCIVTHWRDNPNSGKGHVNIYLGDFPDGRYAGLGGNQGDKVSISRYGKSRVVGYWWPVGVPIPAGAAPVSYGSNAGDQGSEV